MTEEVPIIVQSHQIRRRIAYIYSKPRIEIPNLYVIAIRHWRRSSRIHYIRCPSESTAGIDDDRILGLAGDADEGQGHNNCKNTLVHVAGCVFVMREYSGEARMLSST